MGYVKVELPFESMDCNACFAEGSTHSLDWNYCELFDQTKFPLQRCMKCVENELTEVRS